MLGVVKHLAKAAVTVYKDGKVSLGIAAFLKQHGDDN